MPPDAVDLSTAVEQPDATEPWIAVPFPEMTEPSTATPPQSGSPVAMTHGSAGSPGVVVAVVAPPHGPAGWLAAPLGKTFALPVLPPAAVAHGPFTAVAGADSTRLPAVTNPAAPVRHAIAMAFVVVFMVSLPPVVNCSTDATRLAGTVADEPMSRCCIWC